MNPLLKVLALFLLTGMAGCASVFTKPEPTLPEPEQFKNAIIAYIDTHQGFFIGRKDSGELKSEAIVLWGKDSDGSPVYSLVEFIIHPKEMYFSANYGMQSIEPYLYKGEFIRTKDGEITVGNIDLTRLHMDPATAGK